MNRLPDPAPGEFWLIIAPGGVMPSAASGSAAGGTLWEFVARLALQGRLRVLDGGNRFNAYAIARALGARLAGPSPFDSSPFAGAVERTLERISVARAFTCYQVLALLADTPADHLPTLALDLLATFYDENVPVREAEHLLNGCLVHLRRLSSQAPLVITVHLRSHPVCEERAAFLQALRCAAGQVWVLEAPAARQQQPRLPHL